MAGLVLAVLVGGCLAESGAITPPGSGGGDGGGPAGSGPFCETAAILQARCVLCHRTGGQFPDLTLEAAATGLIEEPSRIAPAQVLVRPGDRAASFLYRKVAGPLSSTEGAMMPLGAPITAEEVDAIGAWIDAGAAGGCSPDGDGGLGGDGAVPRYHPDGYRDPTIHGVELELGALDCRQCHGQDLTGGAGPSCDSCHRAEWRTTCTYCHGGTVDTTGAPPRDLGGETLREALSFIAHAEHVAERNHAPYDCTQCHAKPMDVLTEGHVFDDTPGAAEVGFSAGLSSAGTYAGGGRCDNLYCHGNGRTAASFTHDRARPDCDGCHAGPTSGETGARTLSGRHRDHVRENIRCDECHAMTVSSSGAIATPAAHVNGTKDVVFAAAGMTRAGTCTGTCHNEVHQAERW